MHHSSSWPLRIAYVLTVLAAVLPVGLASSGWVALTTGGSPFMIVPYVGPLLFLLLGIYRVVVVLRYPGALDSPQVSGVAAILRNVGLVALHIGAVVGVVNLLSRPLTRLIFTRPSESGIEFYIVGVYLALFGGIGLLGLVFFELSRLLGFESHARNARRA